MSDDDATQEVPKEAKPDIVKMQIRVRDQVCISVALVQHRNFQELAYCLNAAIVVGKGCFGRVMSLLETFRRADMITALCNSTYRCRMGASYSLKSRELHRLRR